VPINGNPIKQREAHFTGFDEPPPLAGYLDPALISDRDLSNSAHRIQYLPTTGAPADDQDDLPAAPTDLQVTGSFGANSIIVTVPSFKENDSIEVYGSSTNNRTDALLIASGLFNTVAHFLPTGSARYYWARVRRLLVGPDRFSEWFPASETGGILAAPKKAGTDDLDPDAVTEIYSNDVDWEGLAPVDGYFANFITFTPERTGSVIASFSGNGKSSVDRDSGSYLLMALGKRNELIELADELKPNSASAFTVYGSSTTLQAALNSVGFSYEFDLTEGVEYSIGVLAVHAAGTFNLYDTHLSLLVRKR
jgi:hypothetical protein